MSYNNLLSTLQNSILDNSPANNWVQPQQGFTADDKLNVYIKGYRLRLFDVVIVDYELTTHLLGKKQIANLLKQYIEQQQSHSFDLFTYSQNFARFLQTQNIPDYAKHMADIEASILQVFTLAESTNMDINTLQNIDINEFANMQLHLRSAAMLKTYSYDVNSYMSEFYNNDDNIINDYELSSATAYVKFDELDNNKAANTPSKEPCYVLIFRHNNIVRRLKLDKLEYKILRNINSGQNVGTAINSAAKNESDQHQLAQNITYWFSKWSNNNILRDIREVTGNK